MVIIILSFLHLKFTHKYVEAMDDPFLIYFLNDLLDDPFFLFLDTNNVRL